MRMQSLYFSLDDTSSIKMPLPAPATLQILSFIILSFGAQMLLSDCPRLCECKWKSGKESVICFNANLSVVPLHLDRGTQVLDLTGNNIIAIRNDEFSQAGLLNLQKIYVARCKIKTLERFAFRNLINLVELDLSYNLLQVIPSHVLSSIPELRELRLSGNPIEQISNEAFIDVGELTRLELNDCKITHIEAYAFRGLEKSLRWLKLDHNGLSEVDAAAFTILQGLHELELAGNPWNCSCSLRPLREWMIDQNVPFVIPPVCNKPPRLMSKSWDKLDLDEFACAPEIFPYDSKAHGVEGKNVTMTCRVAGIPEPTVRWLLKNKVIANLSGNPYSNGKKMYVVYLQNKSSDLTILTADVQDAGVYVCSAENKAGRAEASVTLAVSRKPTENALSSKVLVASIVAGTLFVLASCLTAVCLCNVRKNKVRWRRGDCNREDNYEKIEMNHKMQGNVNGGSVVQNDISLVSESVRKNGEYRVVPGADTDQDVDEEEENTEATSSIPKSHSASNQWCNEGTSEKKWNSPDHLLDPEDLHIPRRTLKEARDDFNKKFSSTSGTYNPKSLTTQPTTPPRPQVPYESTSSICTPTFACELSSLIEEDKDKRFPDLLENSPPTRGHHVRNATKACSEGGSVTDITDLFCTLPRKRTLMQNARYRSSDSQSPLLPESRYCSSGGDSSTESCSSSSRRLSDSQKFPFSNLGRSRANHISNSYLNLTSNTRCVNLPSSSIVEGSLNSTPLLDINSLENRVQFRPEVLLNSPSTVATNVNAYDYHAAQLERFLEEYRSLQKQLTKMKETCDTLRHEKISVDGLLQYSLPVTPSSDEVRKVTTKPTSPNANTVLDNSSSGYNTSDLAKYLLSKSPSPNPMNNGMFKS